MAGDLLTSFSNTETDVLFTILQKLSLRSLLRLYSSCSTLKGFIYRHQAAIRQSLSVSFKVVVEEKRVCFSIDVDDSVTKQIRIKNGDIIGDLAEDAAWLATERVVLKQEDGGWIISSEAPLETAMQLLSGPFRDFNIDVIDFCTALKDVELNWGGTYQHSPVIEELALTLIQFLCAEGGRVRKLIWPVIEANTSRVFFYIEQLQVQDLEVIVKRNENSQESRDLSRKVFQSNRALRRFTSEDLYCDLSDEDLERFDCLILPEGGTNITAAGILSWARRKMLEGRYGDELKLPLKEAELSEVRQSLEAEYFTKMSPTNFRGPTGTWMKAFLGPSHLGQKVNLIIMESFDSSKEAPTSSPRLFNWPQELVHNVKVSDSGAVVHLVTGNESWHGEYVFHLNEKPSDDAFFIERWADDVDVYNLEPQHYLMHVVRDKEGPLDEGKKTEVLRLLGEKLRGLKFKKAHCESNDSDAALQLLQKIQAGYQDQISHLSVRGNCGPTEELLIRTVQSVKAARFSFYFYYDDSESDTYLPWRLTERFFIETPALKAFALRPLFSYQSNYVKKVHFLGVTDDTLTRFHKFKAPTALTLVTKEGVRSWIKAKLHEDVVFGEDDKVLRHFNARGKAHAKFVTEPEERAEGRQDGSDEGLLSISLMDATKRGEGGTYMDQEWNADYALSRDRESSGWDSNEGSWAYSLEGRSYWTIAEIQ